MHPVIQTVRQALGYAKFDDVAIHNRTLKLLDEVGTDLELQSWEPNPDVTIADGEVTEAINAYDQEVEDLDRAVKESREEDEEEV